MYCHLLPIGLEPIEKLGGRRVRVYDGHGVGDDRQDHKMARAHAGDLTLLCSDNTLTTFALRLPL